MTTKRQREWNAEHQGFLDQLIELLIAYRNVACLDQREYKTDFFRVFSIAYRAGYCSPRYRADLETDKWKVIAKDRPLIYGDTIAEEARRRGCTDSNDSESSRLCGQIDLVRTWWDEWTFAWDHNPPPERRTRTQSRSLKTRHSNE